MINGTIYSLLQSQANPNGYPASLTQTGQVLCNDEIQGSAVVAATATGFVPMLTSTITVLWVSILVILHILLSVILTSVGAIWILRAKWVDENGKKLVNSPSLMVASMPVLAVGAAAEVAQHVFDNWLYLGLIPTYYLATFYSGLALGQTMLALGVWDGPPGRCWVIVLPLACIISFITIVRSGTHCTQQARDTTDDPDFTYGNCISFAPFIPAFATLGVATISIFCKANAPSSTKTPFLIAALVSLAVGIGSSLVLTFTGLQWLHVPTASGFLGLFLSELLFVRKIPMVSGGEYRRADYVGVEETMKLV